jgi:hypothetical protein
MKLTVLWQATAQHNAHPEALIEAADVTGKTHVLLRRPLAGVLPWQAGEVREGRYLVSIPADLPGGDYRVHVRLSDDVATLGRMRIEVPNGLASLPPTAVPASALFGSRVGLLGHSPLPVMIRRGETMTVSLYWQAEKTGIEDITGFVHLLGPDGRLYGQHDSVPAEGQRPFAGWRSAEVVEDTHRFEVSVAAPSGTYMLEIGLYDSKTLRRWPGESDGVPLAEDRLLLGPIDMRQ